MITLEREELHCTILDFIENFLIQQSFPPSMRDILAGVPEVKSLSTLRLILRSMRADGSLDFDDNIARSIRLPWK